MSKKEDKLLVWDYFCSVDNELRKNRKIISKLAIRFNLQEKLDKWVDKNGKKT
jgi:hypothetical protein